MLIDKKVGFIGAGNMAETLLGGLISSNQSKPENIICSDVRPKRLEQLKDRYGIQTTADNNIVIQSSEIIVYAVKPQIMAEVLKETADALDLTKLIISIAAGVPLAAIETLINKDLRLIRAMPNLCVAPSRHALRTEADRLETPTDAALVSVSEPVVIRQQRSANDSNRPLPAAAVEVVRFPAEPWSRIRPPECHQFRARKQTRTRAPEIPQRPLREPVRER